MPFHWENMKKVKTGDIIFNYAYKYIQGVSIAKNDGFETVDKENAYRDKDGKIVEEFLKVNTKHFEFKINKLHKGYFRNFI